MCRVTPPSHGTPRLTPVRAHLDDIDDMMTLVLVPAWEPYGRAVRSQPTVRFLERLPESRAHRRSGARPTLAKADLSLPGSSPRTAALQLPRTTDCGAASGDVATTIEQRPGTATRAPGELVVEAEHVLRKRVPQHGVQLPPADAQHCRAVLFFQPRLRAMMAGCVSEDAGSEFERRVATRACARCNSTCICTLQ